MARRRTEGSSNGVRFWYIGDMESTPTDPGDLLEHMTRTADRTALKLLEWQFRERAPSYFGVILKRPRLVEYDDLDALDAALTNGTITERQARSISWLDAIVRGKDKREPGGPETLLALEVSLTIDAEDVIRARARAAVLTAAGYRAFGAVGGEAITERAQEMAVREGVIVRFATPDDMPRAAV